MSIGKDILASATGNVETALIVIHDYREAGRNMMKGNISQSESLSILNTKRRFATEAALGQGVSNMPAYEGSRDKYFSVQFNPSQLTLNGAAVPQNKTNASDGTSRTIAAEDAKLTLTVILQFDDMDAHDAFMWDKFTAGLASAQGISDAAKIAAGAVTGGKKEHSVRPRIEALVAALRNPFTRTISFRWADFVFIGQLSTVQARYTMFNPGGRPVRGQVLLRIQHEMDPSMLTGWYKEFEEAFGNSGTNLVKPEQTTSNLLNFIL